MATDQQITSTALAIRNARAPEVNGQQATENAFSLRSSRAMEGYVATVEKVTKLAVNKSHAEGLDALREEVLEIQKRSLEVQENLIAAIAEMLSSLRDAGPLVVNVPETKLTMQQQPVTVNLPKASPVQLAPVIKVPQTKVVIEKPEKKVPKRAIIKHSDGTQSTIEIT